MEGNKRMALLALSALVPTLGGIGIFSCATLARVETTPHIIINEIQTASANSNDEFVELFNPIDTPIVLDGYKYPRAYARGFS